MSFRIPAGRALLRTAVALSTAGAALAAGAGAASARSELHLPSSGDVVGGTLQGLDSGVAPIKHLQLYPLAKTTVDPLTNTVGTRIADFKPITTRPLTKPLSDGDSLSQLPLVGQLTKILPGG
ncbi:hypothetical protein [Streptantibioticus ferralitis]|uniref:Secreted protein n=1 Tax=Streptantibioticus ferralitis TaxID=236510 RepID=A0ABT5Z1Z4_9ACTN|nr:hypothetical protein [Streptantibioticus ferralitis]MDF2257840.1 hypothetical protein [Streptantibioticus ferralitis]